MNNVYTFEKYLRDNHVFSKFNMKKIGVFGSFARNEQNSDDIDILIEEDIAPEKLIAFKEVLEKSLHKKIDIVLKKYANPIILYRAEKDLKYATAN